MESWKHECAMPDLKQQHPEFSFPFEFSSLKSKFEGKRNTGGGYTPASACSFPERKVLCVLNSSDGFPSLFSSNAVASGIAISSFAAHSIHLSVFYFLILSFPFEFVCISSARSLLRYPCRHTSRACLPLII